MGQLVVQIDSYRGLGRVLSRTPSACAGRQEFFGTADPFADLAWVEYLDEGTGGETERPRVSAPSHTAAATCPWRMGYMHTCPYMPPPAQPCCKDRPQPVALRCSQSVSCLVLFEIVNEDIPPPLTVGRMVAAHWPRAGTVHSRGPSAARRDQAKPQTTVGAACDSSGAGQDQRAKAECQVEDNDDDAQGRRADRL